MFMFPDSITKKLNKEFSSGKTPMFASMYPDSSGYVYVSSNGVPVEWQDAEKRKEITPVCQVYVKELNGKQVLGAKNLSKEYPIASQLPSMFGKMWSLDFLLSGGFISEEMLVASVNSADVAIEGMATLAKALLDTGMSMEKIKVMLNMSSEQLDEVESRVNLLNASHEEQSSMRNITQEYEIRHDAITDESYLTDDGVFIVKHDDDELKALLKSEDYDEAKKLLNSRKSVTEETK